MIIIITSSHDNLAKRSFLDSIRIMIKGDPLYGFSQRETKEFAARTVLRPLYSTMHWNSMSLLLLLVLLLNPHYYYSKTALLYSFTEHCTGTQCHYYYYYYFYCYYYIHTYHRSYDYSQTDLLFNLTEQHNTTQHTFNFLVSRHM